MEDLGESEDLQDTDIGAAAIGLSTTTAATIIRKTAWEQTLLALQQLGVSCQCEQCSITTHEVKLIIKINIAFHCTTLHYICSGHRLRGFASRGRLRHHGLD